MLLYIESSAFVVSHLGYLALFYLKVVLCLFFSSCVMVCLVTTEELPVAVLSVVVVLYCVCTCLYTRLDHVSYCSMLQ